MTPQWLQEDRGSSLLEVLVSSTILIVAIVSLAQLLTTEVEANLTAGMTTAAALIAEQKLEDLRAETFKSLHAAAGEFVDSLDRAGRHVEGTGNAEYTRRWSVIPLPDDPENTMMVRVSVATRRVTAEALDVRTRTLP